MRAAVLTGIRRLEIIETDSPKNLGPLEVRIRVTTVGVCGSDVHYYTTGRIGSQVVQYPWAVGHEAGGIVEEVGTGVTRVSPGDRIAIEPAVSCLSCDQCLAGRPHTCRHLTFLGCPGQIEGCLSDFVVMPEASCYRIPDMMTLTQAALSEPLAIGVYAVKLSRMPVGARIGVLGTGPIGLSVITAARAKEAGSILATDKLPNRLDAARKAGAAWTANPVEVDVVSEAAAVEPGGLDLVFECCGQQDAVDQGLQMLKPGGTLMVVGIPEVDRISFSPDVVRRKELGIQHVRRQNHSVQETLDGLADGSLNADFMVTHRFPLEQCKEAFDLVAGYQDGVIKAMVDLYPT